MDLALVSVIVFMSIAAVVVAGFMVVRDLVGAGAVSGGGTVAGRRLRRVRNVFDQEPATTATGRLDQSFERLVLETGWAMDVISAFLLVVACGLLTGGVLLVYYDQPLAGICGGLAGMLLPLIVFFFRRRKRMREMHEQLPNVLDLTARAVRAGYSMDQAISFVGAETPGALGGEFQRCARQIEMGRSVSATMQSLAKRVRLLELRMLATTVSVHRRVGGNLPEALERMAGVVRDRLNYRRQMRASTGAGRASAILIAGISPLLYVIMFMWQPDHVRPLLEDPKGQTLLMAAIVLEIIGIIWVIALLRTDK